jgi:threonine dehydrogenase-like Zn-dependent dehydrogenase
VNKPIQVKEFPLVDPDERSLTVKIDMASLCGTDVHMWRGRRIVPFPLIPGHEGIGRIHKLGKKVSKDSAGNKVRSGDRIVWSHVLHCRNCYYCFIKKDPSGCQNKIIYGYISSSEHPYLNGTLAEYMYLRPNTVFYIVPEEISDEVVVPASCALGTAINGINRARVDLGDNVLVQGIGPLGLYSIALAKERGAKKVVAIGEPGIRFETAKLFGADYVINRFALDVNQRIQKVKDLFDGRGADLAIECSGYSPVIIEGIEMLDHGGRYLLLGTASENVKMLEINPSKITLRRLLLIGSRATEPHHLLEAIKYLQLTKLPVERMISHKYSLEDAEKAFKAYEDLKVVKAAFTL